MSELDFDPVLFGLWPKAAVYGGLGAEEDAALQDVARRVILDTKAETVSPLDDLQDMLNGMTKELREQMQQFQRLRHAADESAIAEGQEIDRKLIQADAKAAIEAMSVIVRTLEKIDSLQRTIAHDRQAQAEAAFDEEGYQALLAEFERRVEQRVEVRVGRKAAGAASGDGRDGHEPSDGGGRGDKPGAPRGSPGDQS